MKMGRELELKDTGSGKFGPYPPPTPPHPSSLLHPHATWCPGLFVVEVVGGRARAFFLQAVEMTSSCKLFLASRYASVCF